MGIKLYNRAKQHYEKVKPIRGKRLSENIRPMGSRTRTWERVVEDVRSDGAWYGYRLYSSDLVMISPTGIIECKTDGYPSVVTGQFIYEVGLRFFNNTFGARKKNNKIWVYTKPNYTEKAFPIQAEPMQFSFVDTDKDTMLLPLKDVIEEKPIIDRKAMKEAMTPYMPMIKYINAMLRLTGGLLTYEFRKQSSDGVDKNDSWRQTFIYKFSTGDTLKEVVYSNNFTGSDNYFDVMTKIVTDGTEEDWMKFMCAIAKAFEYSKEVVGQEVCEMKWGDKTHKHTIYFENITVHASPSALRERIARMVKARDESVWKSKFVNHSL
jgi:hypothetical protein